MSKDEIITKEQFNMYIATLEYSMKKGVPYSKIDPKNDIYNLKYYVIQHLDDENVLIFLKWVAESYCELILNENMTKILNMPDEYKYFKIEKFCEHFPFKKESFLISQLFNIFYVDDEYFQYRSAIYRTLEKYYKKFYTFYDEETYKKFIEMIDNSKNLPLFEPDYKSLNTNDAVKLYLKCVNNDETVYNENHYLSYKTNILQKCDKDEEEIKKLYKNKLLGNIGEIYAATLLDKNICHNINISSITAGDGLGYDLYYDTYDNNGNVCENLVEVKTTERDFTSVDTDFFTLSKNEYNFMCDRLREKDANYYIIRVYSTLKVNNNLKEALSYGVLFPLDEHTLISETEPTVQFDIKYNGQEGKYYCRLKENTRKRV